MTSPAAVSILAGALIALAAGCGGGNDEERADGGTEPGKPEAKDSAAGIALVADPAAVAAGEELQVRVSNETSVRLTYGRGYRIERLEEGGWVPLELPVRPVPMIGLIAPPGELGPPITVQVPGDADPGSYRVLLAQPPKGVGSLAAEFEVE